MLNIILIPRLGILGAAIATLIAYGVLGILTLLVSRRYLKFDLSMPFVLKSTLVSAIITLCIWLINPESITLVIISIFAGALIYFGGLLLIKGLSKSEVVFFVNFAKDNFKEDIHGRIKMLWSLLYVEFHCEKNALRDRASLSATSNK